MCLGKSFRWRSCACAKPSISGLDAHIPVFSVPGSPVRYVGKSGWKRSFRNSRMRTRLYAPDTSVCALVRAFDRALAHAPSRRSRGWMRIPVFSVPDAPVSYVGKSGWKRRFRNSRMSPRLDAPDTSVCIVIRAFDRALTHAPSRRSQGWMRIPVFRVPEFQNFI